MPPPTLQELRSSPAKVLALSWIAGMALFVFTGGERATEQWAAERHAMEDAGPDAGPAPNAWDDGGHSNDDLDFLLDDEEGGTEEEDEGGLWVPPSEDAGDLLLSTGEGGALADLEDDDGGDFADLDEDEEERAAQDEDGGGGVADDESDASPETVAARVVERRKARRAERIAAAARRASDAGATAAEILAAEVSASSFNVRASGESAVQALAASWPLAPEATPGKDDLAARKFLPIDARIVGTAAIRALDVAWGADPQVAELETMDEPDASALAEALSRKSLVALRARFRAVVPPLSSIKVLERDRDVVLRIGDADPFVSTDSAGLNASAARELARVAPVLAAIPDRRFRIVVSHASAYDEGGTPEPGASVDARVRSVARVLVRHGLLPSHLDWTPGDVEDRALASDLWPPSADAAAKSGVAIVLEPRAPRPIAEPRSHAKPDAGSAPRRKSP